MTRIEKLIADIARLNENAGEIGAGMLAHIVSEARAIEEEAYINSKVIRMVDGNKETS